VARPRAGGTSQSPSDGRDDHRPQPRPSPRLWDVPPGSRSSASGECVPRRSLGTSKRNTLSIPKGRRQIARGVNPGKTGQQEWKAPEGRLQVHMRSSVAPPALRGSRAVLRDSPGLTPRAICHCPSGAESSRLPLLLLLLRPSRSRRSQGPSGNCSRVTGVVGWAAFVAGASLTRCCNFDGDVRVQC
jgi:hypothetical protein